MTKIKKLCLTILACAMCVSGIAIVNNNMYAQAEQQDVTITVHEDRNLSTYGLYTALDLSIYSNDGQIYVAVKNKFTLFPATVIVKVELYGSDTYQGNYNDMTLVASNYISDLDQGETITATTPTNGIAKYWKGRVYYKIDSKPWEERVTETMHYDAYGNLI